MAIEIIMPAGGQTTDKLKLVNWHKEVGDQITKGEVLFEIETDKAVMDVESRGSGILLKKCYQEGDDVDAGEIVAYIGEKGEKIEDIDDSTTDESNTAVDDESEKESVATSVGEKDRDNTSMSMSSDNVILASPAARYLVKENNIQLKEVYQNFAKDVIKKADVEAYLEDITDREEADKKEDIKAKQKSKSEDEFYYIKTSSMRKTIAERMTASVNNIPQYSITIEVDMKKLIELITSLNDNLTEEDYKISYNDLIIKCASKAITNYPLINATYKNEKIKVYQQVNFGLAVSVEEGLVVPVVSETNNKSLSEIARENKNNIEKVKKGAYNPEEYDKGTITLSNLGMFGVEDFQALINPPESCILALGEIKEKPVSKDGEFVSRPMMKVTATFDHRLIDGAYGAEFLQELKSLLENPELPLL